MLFIAIVSCTQISCNDDKSLKKVLPDLESCSISISGTSTIDCVQQRVDSRCWIVFKQFSERVKGSITSVFNKKTCNTPVEPEPLLKVGPYLRKHYKISIASILLMVYAVYAQISSVKNYNKDIDHAYSDRANARAACNSRLVCPEGYNYISTVNIRDDNGDVIWVPIVDTMDRVAVKGWEEYVHGLITAIVNDGEEPEMPAIPPCILKNFGYLQGTDEDISRECQRKHKSYLKLRNQARLWIIGIVLAAIGNLISVALICTFGMMWLLDEDVL